MTVENTPVHNGSVIFCTLGFQPGHSWHRGEWCVFDVSLLCQEGYCCRCQIWQDNKPPDGHTGPGSYPVMVIHRGDKPQDHTAYPTRTP